MMDILNYTKMMLPQIADGLKITLQVFGLTLLFSIPLGILIALCRLARFKVNILGQIANIYILVMRGTPLLLQIIFIFFGLPNIGVKIDRMPSAILAFTLNYAAYFAEIFRAGIQSVDDGQNEAAEVLGLSKINTFFRIILPQAFKRVLPPVGNEIVTLIKDTALVYAVGFDDLLKIGKTATNRDATLLPLVIIAIVYLILVCILSKIMSHIEKKYDYYK